MMFLRTNRIVWILIAAAGFLALSSPAAACSVCQGNPDSELVKGAQGGVIVMIIVTYGVLLCFGAMVALWFVRARRLSRTTMPPAATNAPNRESRPQQSDD